MLAFFGNYFKDTDVAADHLVNHFGPSAITISGGESGTHSRLDMFRYGLERTVTDLENSGKEVVLMVDVPELPFFPKDCIPRLFKSTPARGCVIPESVAMERQAELRGLIDDIRGRHPRLRVFDPIEFLCEGDVCRIEADGVLIYRDSHHLSPRGSERIARHLVTWLYGRSD